MRRFILQSCYFILGMTGCFLLLELPVQWNYAIQNSDMGDWQALADIDADIVLVGNSRTWTTYNTEYMSQKLGASVYALAQDGWECNLLETKLKHYLSQNNIPEFIFIQADPAILGHRDDWYDKPNFLKYLWLDREGLHSTMRGYEGNHWWEWGIPFIRYLSYPHTYIRDSTGGHDPLNRRYGSWPDSSTTAHPLSKLPITKWSISEDALAYLERVSSIQGSEIYFFASPISQTLSTISEFEPIKAKAACLDLDFIDLTRQGLPDSYFRNHTHVNRFGSEWATDTLTAFIRQIQIHALQQP